MTLPARAAALALLSPLLYAGPASAQSAATEERLMLDENFADNRRAWLQWNAENGRIAVEYNHLAIETRAESFAVVVPHRLDENGDWRIELTISNIAGEQASGYGLVFGHRTNIDHHRLLVSGNGSYMVGTYDNNVWKPSINWTSSGAIRTGTGVTNVLMITKRGYEYIFHINQQEVNRMRTIPLLGSGVGVVASPNGTVHATRLRVWETTRVAAVADRSPDPPDNRPPPPQLTDSANKGGGGAKGPPKVVAVFDFQDMTRKTGADLLTQLPEYLGALLAKKGSYAIVPREQLKAQINDAKKETYKACYDTSCQIELGKALAAEGVVSTKILRLGKECVLTSTLFDLKSETVIRAATAESSCTDKALLGGVQKLAEQL